MSISGVVLHVRSDRISALGGEIAALPGVEVHASTPDGRMVVTIDRPDDGAAVDTFSQFRRMEGVLSTSLVYSHFEPLSDLEEPAE